MKTLKRLGGLAVLLGALASPIAARGAEPAQGRKGVLPAAGATFADYLPNGQAVMVRPDGSKFIGGQLEVMFSSEVMQSFYQSHPSVQVHDNALGTLPSEVAGVLGGFGVVAAEPLYLNDKFPGQNVWQLRVGDSSQLDGLVDALYQSKMVRMARPDPLLEANSVPTQEFAPPNDPEYSKQYGIPQANIDQAWDVTTGRADVKIGVVDSGIAQAHFDIAQNLAACVDVSGSADGCEDVHGHGTNVAGVAIARINNNNCIAGVAGTSSLVAVKISDTGGGAALLDTGIYKARDLGSRVINVSYAISPAWLQSVQDVFNQGVVVVSAAGQGATTNDPGTDAPRAPASMYEALGVGAIDSTGTRLSWSNWGPNVDLMAPGDAVFTTFNNGCGGTQGTSFASPFAAGAAGLVISNWLNQGLCGYTVDDVYAALLGTATPLPAGNPDPVYYGVGKLNGAVFLSVDPSCKTSVGAWFGNSTQNVTACYNDNVQVESGASVLGSVYQDASCVLQSQLLKSPSMAVVQPWSGSSSWSYGPVTASQDLVVQAKLGGEKSGCWSSSPVLSVSLTPSNVESVQAGPDRSPYCAGDVMFVNKAATMYSGCSPCSLEYLILEGGSPVTGWGANPSLVMSAPGVHSYSVAARCVGEPDGREVSSVPFGVGVLDNGVPSSVDNGLRVTKGSSPNQLVLDTSLAPGAAGERIFAYGTVKLTAPPSQVVDAPAGGSYVLTLSGGLQGKGGVSVDVRNLSCDGTIESPN